MGTMLEYSSEKRRYCSGRHESEEGGAVECATNTSNKSCSSLVRHRIWAGRPSNLEQRQSRHSLAFCV